MKLSKKVKIFIIPALLSIFVILGVISIIATGEGIFSRYTLSESYLIVVSCLWLFLKYLTGRLILKYQDVNYSPSKRKRKIDDLIVYSTIKGVNPLLLNLAVACSILLAIKYLPGHTENVFAEIVYFTNEEIFGKSSKLLLFIPVFVLGIFVLLDYLKYDYFKSAKKFIGYVTAPVKVFAILVFFIHFDQGIRNDGIAFALNKTKIERKDPSEQKKNLTFADQAIDEFVDQVIQALEVETSAASNEDNKDEETYDDLFVDDSSDNSRIIRVSGRLTSFQSQYSAEEEQVFTEVVNGIGGNRSQYQETRAKFNGGDFDFGEPKYSSYTDFTETVYTKENDFFEHLTEVFSAEAKPSTTVSNKIEVIKAIIKGTLLENLPTSKLKEILPVHRIISNHAISFIKDNLGKQIAKGFMYLLGKSEVTRKDVNELKNFYAKSLKKEYLQARFLTNKDLVFVRKYYSGFNTTINQRVKEKFNVNPKGSKTYLDGLKERKIAIQRNISWIEKEYGEYLTIDRSRVWEIDDIKARNELRNLWKVYDDYLSDLKTIQRGLSNPELLSEFDFIKTTLSSGGIFFGKSADFSKQIDLVECVKSGDSIDMIIQIADKSYKFTEPIDQEIFLSAYNFIFSPKSYPVLVDGYYDSLEKKNFAYNECLIHSESLLTNFKDADEFIFRILENENNTLSKHEAHIFKPAIELYSQKYDNTTGEPVDEIVSLSRIFDQEYIQEFSNIEFSIKPRFKFSVVSKTDDEEDRYNEIEELSKHFNDQHDWIINSYDYFKTITDFSIYQAILRNVESDKVEVIDLF